MIEPLEIRQMLSVGMTVSKGVLLVQGSTDNDIIVADQTDTAITVSVNDYAFSAPLHGLKAIRIMGDAGNDTITVNPTVRLQALLYGGPGNDRLIGSDARCRLSGDAGNDLLHPGHGRDIITGGPGVDAVDYSQRTDDLVITLDNKPNDGAPASTGSPAEGDNVMSDCELIRTGSGNDRIVGNSLANTLIGGAGNDSLYGLAGNDALVGGAGNDLLAGGNGDDLLLAIDLAAGDSLNGGNGNDAYAIDSVQAQPDRIFNCEIELTVLET